MSAFVDDVLLYRHTPPDEEARIAEQARLQTMRTARPLMLVASTMGLLWWPADFVLYAGRPEIIRVFALWRSAVIIYCLAYYLTCDRWALVRRHYALWGTLLGSAIAFVIGASLGSLGGMEQPWFGSLYLVPIMSFPFLLRPIDRVAGTVTVALVALAGFFGAHPANLSHPNAATSFGLMLFSIVVSVCAGHAMYHWFRVSFLQSERLEELSRTLADRVEARTSELRLLAAHVDKMHETERSDLARELHDELGQFLQCLRVELDLAERARARGTDTAGHHARLASLLDDTLASTRSILSHLRPRILDDLGLVAAVEWLASDLSRQSGLDVSVASEPREFELPVEAATGMFRMVQESLTNVRRHARARHVQIHLALTNAGLRASVMDDGVGLPPPEQRRAGSMGLLGMRERAQALGGTLALQTRPSGGTEVTIHLPPGAVGFAAPLQELG